MRQSTIYDRSKQNAVHLQKDQEDVGSIGPMLMPTSGMRGIGMRGIGAPRSELPTMELRFLHGVLQQKWEVRVGFGSPIHTEWRDVAEVGSAF